MHLVIGFPIAWPMRVGRQLGERAFFVFVLIADNRGRIGCASLVGYACKKIIKRIIAGAGFYIFARGIGNTIGCAEDWLRRGLVESAPGVFDYRVFLKNYKLIVE